MSNLLTSVKSRLQGIGRLFWVIVILPTTVASIYFGLIASDVYISQSKFVIYNPQQPSSAGGLSMLLQGAGFSSSTYGIYAAHDYILSRDALQKLQSQLNIRAMYSAPGIDWINRFGGLLYFRTTFEELFKYYRHMVGDSVDPTSNVSTLTVNAYTPSDAQRINRHLLQFAQHLVDQINATANEEGVQFYQQQVASAEAHVQAAFVAMASYRNHHGVFNPAPQSALQLQLVSKLQDQLIQEQSRLAQLLLSTPNNPQLPLLKRAIASTQADIARQTATVAGGPHSLASKSVDYGRLALDQGFAEKELAAAITALEQARIQAQKQQLFIETVVTPNRPDEALEPKRWRGVLATLVVGVMLWGVLSVIIGGVKEHHDR